MVKDVVRLLLMITCLLIFIACPEQKDESIHITESFDELAQGTIPSGWFVEPARNFPGRWSVTKYSKSKSSPNILQYESYDNDSGYTILINEDVITASPNIKVDFLCDENQAYSSVGVVICWFDENNYYLYAVNPQENMLRLYFFDNGSISVLASTNISIEPGVWYTMHVMKKGTLLSCSLNGNETLSARNGELEFGGVGLWSPININSYFDNFVILKNE